MGKPRKARRLTRAQNRNFRRESLIEAAARVIARHDLPGATVERICEEAGVSHGLLGHYFDSKEALLLVVCKGTFEGDLAIKRAIAADMSRSPLDRLLAMVESTFLSPVYSPEGVAVWQAFLNASRSQETFRSAILDGAAGYREVFGSGLAAAADEVGVIINVERVALGLIALIDGFWTGLSTGKDNATPQDAVAVCSTYLRACLHPDRA